MNFGPFDGFVNLDNSSEGGNDVDVDASELEAGMYPSGETEFWKDMDIFLNFAKSIKLKWINSQSSVI